MVNNEKMITFVLILLANVLKICSLIVLVCAANNHIEEDVHEVNIKNIVKKHYIKTHQPMK